MAGAENMIEIKVFEAHFRHDPGIRQNVALVRARKNDRKSGLLAGKFTNRRNIGTTLGEAREAKATKGICADGGVEAHAVAEQGEIVSEDSRGTAEREAKIGSKMFAVQLQLNGKTVEDEIEIQLADDT